MSQTVERRGSPSAPRVVLLVYAFSGAAALIYQVIWYHSLVDLLGAVATTFLIVLCSFIGGLGLGAICSRFVIQWVENRLARRGLALYGCIELTLTLAAPLLLLLTHVPLDTLVGVFPYRETLQAGLHIYVPSLVYQVVRLILTLLAVGFPCFLMGLTFPYLCSMYKNDSRFPSRLYAANTLGACLAVLLTEFVALEYIGYLGCLGLAIAISFSISVWALRQPSARAVKPVQTPTPNTPATTGLFPGIISGFLCGGLQALVFILIKLTLQSLRGSFALLSFLAIAGIFLASIAVHRFQPKRTPLLVAMWTALGLSLMVWLTEPRVSQSLVLWAAHSSLSPYAAGFVSTSLVAAFQIFVPYTLWSALLPDLCNRLQRHGQTVARAYGFNTLAFLAGVLLFGWGLQYVNFFYSARVFGLSATALLLVLTIFKWDRPLPIAVFPVLLCVLVVGAFLLPRGLELRLIGGQRAAPHALAFQSTPQHLFWVKEALAGQGRSLMFDRHAMSGTAHTSQTYMRQMAHFPLLLSNKPQRALLICFGVGVTADAIRKHSTISQMDVVDLNPAVYHLNSWFAPGNGTVLADHKLRLFADDGRQFLNVTQGAYDFATMEPPPPFMPGISRLYSREFYAELKRHLHAGAVVSQWLPEHELDQRAVDLIIATFVNSFPHAFLFVGVGRELILVGSDAPFDFGSLRDRWAAEPLVRADLARLGLTSPHQLLATILRTTTSLQEQWLSGPIIRDGFVSLEAMLIGMGQANHSRNPFWATKPNLVLDRADVKRTLSASAPAELPFVMALWDDPQSEKAFSSIVPAPYFRTPYPEQK